MLARWHDSYNSRSRAFRRDVQTTSQRWKAASAKRLATLGGGRLALVAIGAFILVAIVYLGSVSNAAVLARDLRVKQLQIAEMKRENAQLRYQIAALASPAAVEQRAKALGLGPARKVIYADMPWIQPPPDELMPAFLPQPDAITAPETFDAGASTTLEQLLSLLGLQSLAARLPNHSQ